MNDGALPFLWILWTTWESVRKPCGFFHKNIHRKNGLSLVLFCGYCE